MAVYKYVPLLGKSIQVQNIVITVDAITLLVQANTTVDGYQVDASGTWIE